VTVLSEEKESSSAAANGAPPSASVSRSASAWTSGSSGTRSGGPDRAPDDLEQLVDPVSVRSVGEDARAEREPLVEHRAREEHAPARVDPREELGAERIGIQRMSGGRVGESGGSTGQGWRADPERPLTTVFGPRRIDISRWRVLYY